MTSLDTQRARVLADAVVSAYINEIAVPAPSTAPPEPQAASDIQTAAARRPPAYSAAIAPMAA
jgi:hypothetical protein